MHLLRHALLGCLLCAGCGVNPAVPQLRPVDGGWVSSGFGLREQHPVLGVVPGRTHEGWDFAVAEGTPIRASMAGEVIYAGWHGGHGKAVELAHAGGWTTLYGHAREVRVGPGDRVEAGDIIALVGTTGLSTGPHLHYELRHLGTAVDPGGFLGEGEPRPAPGAVEPVAGLRAVPLPKGPAQALLADLPGEPPARLERPARTWE
ncbi:MAG: M23 family metallopeptidase [Candidatus Sericytochromatia bacterium]|nr:M23 family metallopeptidase [Candidatus Sericytochromatia bacterium]